MAQDGDFLQILSRHLWVKTVSPMERSITFSSRILDTLLHLAASAMQSMAVENDENFAQEAVFASFAPHARRRNDELCTVRDRR